MSMYVKQQQNMAKIEIRFFFARHIEQCSDDVRYAVKKGEHMENKLT